MPTIIYVPRALIASLAITAIIGCSARRGPAALRDHFPASASLIHKPSIGQGYNLETESFVGDCIAGDFEYAGAQDADINFSRSLDERETAESLGFSVNAKARYGAVTATAAASFLRSAASSSYSESTTYSSKLRFKNLNLANAKLTAVGETAKAAGNEQWNQTCGHEFVKQIELGGELYVSMKVDFSSKEDKEAFNASFSIKGPAGSVRGELEKASKAFGRSASISVRAMQLGGNVSRLATILSSARVPLDPNNGQSKLVSGLLVCSMDRIDGCLSVLDQMVIYSSDREDPQAFPQQMNFSRFDPNDPNGPAALRYVTVPYENLAIRMNPAVIEAAVKLQRQRLAEIFDNQLRYANRLSALLVGGIRLAPKQRSEVEAAKLAVGSNIDKIVAAADVCYSKLMECPQQVVGLETAITPVDESLLKVRIETFAQYCDLTSAATYSLSLKTTISELLKIAGQDLNNLGADQCATAEEELRKRTDLFLVEKDLSNIEPLASLPDLQRVFLGANEIQDIRPLAKLRNLKALNLGHNKVSDLSALAALELLGDLRVHGNPITDFAPVEAVSSRGRLIKTDPEACEENRQDWVRAGRLDASDADLFRAFDQALLPHELGNISSGSINGTIRCAEIAPVI